MTYTKTWLGLLGFGLAFGPGLSLAQKTPRSSRTPSRSAKPVSRSPKTTKSPYKSNKTTLKAPPPRKLSKAEIAALLEANTSQLKAAFQVTPAQPNPQNAHHQPMLFASDVAQYTKARLVIKGTTYGAISIKFTAHKGFKYHFECFLSAVSNQKTVLEMFVTGDPLSLNPELKRNKQAFHYIADFSNRATKRVNLTITTDNKNPRSWKWHGCTVTPAKVK